MDLQLFRLHRGYLETGRKSGQTRRDATSKLYSVSACYTQCYRAGTHGCCKGLAKSVRQKSKARVYRKSFPQSLADLFTITIWLEIK